VRIKVALAAVAVALATAGSACSHDPDPSPTPTGQPPSTTATATATATASTTPPPPPLPAAARADTPVGAESFARYYMDVLDYAYQTGNTAPVRAAAHCKGCDAVADGIDAWYRQGGHYEGGAFTILAITALKYVRAKNAIVSVAYSRTDRVLVSSAGKREIVKNETNLRLGFTEMRAAGGWLIINIQTIH
jgi:Family of unknown function (DUF6318)